MIKVDTKQLLADSIVDLAKTRSLGKLTVKDITDNCGAGRQTFYHYFHDKEELIGYVYTNEVNKLLSLFNQNYSFEECIKMILDVSEEKKQFYVKAYKLLGQNSPIEIYVEHAVDYYSRLVIQKCGKDALDKEMKTAICFNSYGAIYSCKEWLNGNIHCSSEEMAKMIIENMPERLKNYIE